ncbi:[citrate (pro-3S)-lyase] ligase [Tissierella praeacuta]|uniref:[citrate (pro-3S)-lyase] ligase n=1 Tax=Tissierella praeacuta TaxID=43131 RepID=UPI001044BFD9|nr:[citrate (pro-3S)-lyase] ligase [Tissierella praeacuta]TCU79515.1 [citrate (pro-3S)-lyase] ligase [Tissierella praeacuta]
MISEDIHIRTICLNNPREKAQVEEFLLSQGLNLEIDVEYTVALYEDDKIVGTGSLSGKVLKCIAVHPDYHGKGFSNKIVSLLINEEYHRGNTHLFIFTKPSNINMFNDMGFYEIAQVKEQVVLLENDPQGIKRYTKKLNKYKKDGNIISSIVMNCNPFTLGHQFLIEKASLNSDFVHVFIVWEDKSLFPPNVRFNLVKEGTKHLSNIILHRGEDYIISNSTFPSYFMKESSNIVKTHALLDLKIFSSYIAPSLGINRRYIGEEPNCLVTKEYNEIMKKVLPNYEIEVIELPRIIKDENVISASKVREYIKNNDLGSIKRIVPSTTYEYLISEEAKPIVNKIRNTDSRH